MALAAICDKFDILRDCLMTKRLMLAVK